MLRSSRSKGQFFFISLMLIITFLSGLQALFSGFSELDLSKPYNSQEDYWFWNMKDQLNRTFTERRCPELESDFMEIKIMSEKYFASKGVEFSLRNKNGICPGIPGTAQVVIEMNMTSANINLRDTFILTSVT